MSVEIIGVPIDLGANRRGVDMGPSAIRYAGLKKAITNLGIQYHDAGNINVPVPEEWDLSMGENCKHLKEVNEVNSTLSQMVRNSLLNGHMPVVLGGDHSIAVGTILGTQSVYKDIGVIWMDAHGDYNTMETSRSGNLHGMSLAASTGAGALEMVPFKSPDTPFVNPEHVVLVGVRDLDIEEAKLLKESKITVFTMSDIDMYGMKEIMRRAIIIAESGTSGFHVSYDMDVISPNEAPGVGTPVSGGLTYREAHLAAEMLADCKKLRSIEIVEVNPILDNRNQTGELAVSLICSLIGKRIL